MTEITTFCNGCFWIEPDEEYQTPRKEPHVCMYHNKIVKHTFEDRNLHPMIVAVPNCNEYKRLQEKEKMREFLRRMGIEIDV